ncbi:hypothetical protein MA16_Dca002140 [Dendrobium catenatum]|uniref:Uncharacterized protein n=1 Tax=Dendrobium catenatum TaxID=906689 RepID=A0A2I0XEJ1_9ASPA|nr:hypothetical protein MA16_Dca002140 [Dendrobium catenatum]
MKCSPKTNGLRPQPGCQEKVIQGGKVTAKLSKTTKNQTTQTKKEEPPRLPTKPWPSKVHAT